MAGHNEGACRRSNRSFHWTKKKKAMDNRIYVGDDASTTPTELMEASDDRGSKTAVSEA